jgi:iron-sulfur cluster repair protein YtfE (RIC family)
MSDTKVHVRKATVLLREDHRKVKMLFRAYEKAEEAEDESGMQEIFEKVREELSIHTQIEEEIFYPAVHDADDEEATHLVQEANEEHRIVKQLLIEIGELPPSDERFCAKMKVLKEGVLHHAKEEEDDLFPIFDELDREVRDEVSERLYARKRELTPEDTDT